MEGKYEIILNTPMGMERGILYIKINSGKVSGIITARGKNNPFNNGQVTGNIVEFFGDVRVAFMKINYKAKCTINNGLLKGVVSTKYGEFKIEGEKIR